MDERRVPAILGGMRSPTSLQRPVVAFGHPPVATGVLFLVLGLGALACNRPDSAAQSVDTTTGDHSPSSRGGGPGREPDASGASDVGDASGADDTQVPTDGDDDGDDDRVEGGAGRSDASGAASGASDTGSTVPASGSAGATGATDSAGGAGSLAAGAAAVADADAESAATELLASPMVFAPTRDGFGVSALLATGTPESMVLSVREAGADAWGAPQAPDSVPAFDLARWELRGLASDTEYEYKLGTVGKGEERILYEGRAVTVRESGAAFSFALLTDTHIGGDPNFTNQGDPAVMTAITEQIAAASPDFVANLGDMLDFHKFGFNVAPPSGTVTRDAYLQYRQLLGDSAGRAAHFGVIGNWEGENGNYPEETIAWSREQRMLYLPGPNPSTYPQGGSEAEDYYAFEWGDALFIVLNVMTYTPTEHLLDTNGGKPEDWTLGTAQFDWLEKTLEGATAKWRFIMIHHAVGGAAADAANAAYGRGGGLAAYVGEQAKVHQLMLDHGVQIFFYGHDHVFTDMVVDDIHYSMPGSAGAIWLFGPETTGYPQSWQEPGWARVDVSPDAVDVKFIGLQGDPIYDYRIE